jgi:hypothetical protein
MLILSFTFMFLSRMLWVLHDLYFWGTDEVKKFVRRVGWHNIKMLFMVLFYLSGFFLALAMAKMDLLNIERVFFALMLVSWGSFEFLYNILQKDARLFDWFRYFKAGVTGKPFDNMPYSYNIQLSGGNRIEFVLNHAFRLHWIEALITILVGLVVAIFMKF